MKARASDVGAAPEPAPRPAPVRGYARGHDRDKEGRPPAIASRTVSAERELLERLEQAAAETLGPEATDEEIREHARRWYEGDLRTVPPPPETPIQRRERERWLGMTDAEWEKEKRGWSS